VRVVLYPAIDLLGGRVVRLRHGDRRSARVYSEDPAAQARAFVAQGAQALHVVDLDAAFGEPRQTAVLARIVGAAAPVPVQVGGGIRGIELIEETLAAGAARVILGTAAVERPELAGEAVRRFGRERIACGIDVKDGRAATRGWTETSGPSPERLAALFTEMGVAWLVVTAVSRDGTMEGFDLQLLREVARSAPAANLIASGGAGSLSHLNALAAARVPGLAGAIAGTALYEGQFSLPEAQAALDRAGELAGC
jgi:phosphoribosylformimino-5-aminoimidazole carboxamide ribotide isomerase